MTMLNSDQIAELEKIAELNDGHCDRCSQTIKIYRYKIAKSHANFLKAMANAVRDSGVNDVDISTIGLAYSVRSQCTKMRQHGLIARVKNEAGAQIARHWLITHKGWEFLNGKTIASKVVVFNNQVLGHDGEDTTIHQVLGERFDPQASKYEEAPVSQTEAKTYKDVRKGYKGMKVHARYKSRDARFFHHQTYEIYLDRLQVGRPVKMLEPSQVTYRDIADFQKHWSIVKT